MMKIDLRSLEALRILGLIPVEDLPNLATDALVQGFNSKALVELAGLSGDENRSAERLFEQSLRDMGQQRMTDTDVLRQYAMMVSSLILTSAIPPLEGAKRIWRAVLKIDPVGFHDLDGFIYAASELDDRPEDKKFFETAIREEARRWS